MCDCCLVVWSNGNVEDACSKCIQTIRLPRGPLTDCYIIHTLLKCSTTFSSFLTSVYYSHLVSLWNLYATFTFRNRFRFTVVIYIEFWKPLTSCSHKGWILIFSPVLCSTRGLMSVLLIALTVMHCVYVLRYLACDDIWNSLQYIGLYCVLIALTKC